jgi:hypothetical protein
VTERAERKGALPNKLGQRTDDGVLLTEACAEPRNNALRRVFLHLRFCMLTMRTIENEYLRNPFDVRDSADKLHWLLAMARRRSGSLILHEIHPSSRVDLLFEGAKLRSRVHK